MPKKRDNDLIHLNYSWLLVKLPNGIYRADGRSNPTGVRRSLGTRNRDEALRQLKDLDLLLAIQNGLVDRSALSASPGSALPLTKGWALYWELCEQRRATGELGANTLKRYRAIWQNFSKFAATQGVTTCEGVTTSLVRRYQVDLERHGRAYATCYIEVTTIKQFIKFLVSEGHLPESTKIRIRLVKSDDTDTYCYTDDEVEAMIAHCEQTPPLRWLGQIIVGLAFTGLRISELSSLRWSDVDLENGMIVLTDERRSRARRKSGDFRTLKGKRSRQFPIHVELRRLLEMLPRQSDGLVFHGPKGARIKPGRVLKRLLSGVIQPLASRFPRRLGEAIGFADGRVHSLRHFFCSLCANNGVPEQMLMSWLGHRSSRMIRRYYHAHDEASKAAMLNVKLKPVGTMPAVAPPVTPQTPAAAA